MSFVSSSVLAQDQSSVSTVAPLNARFTIIQSPLAAKWQFALDRIDGRIFQLADTGSGMIWEETQVVGLSSNKTDTKPHYQMFTSGLAARHTFLLDTDNGLTWLLTV